MQKRVRVPMHKCVYDEADAASSEAVVDSDERVKIDMAEEAIERENGGDEIHVRGVEYIGEHKDRESKRFMISVTYQVFF